MDSNLPTSEAGPDVDSLSAREIELRRQIEQLQDYVEHGPERERMAEEERMRTLPPPSEIQDRLREKKFMDQLSRGELRNEMRNQTKSGLLLCLLILATLAIGWWIYKTVQ
ncbi:hypothetical protein NT6N_12890 [Oceaniferula spumae]|uniref:Uncharacterized protein n=1 Tax=Oceaniferula spumae TaxID=2979115 RepID=A0AAT9FJS4_9BACT